MPTLAQLLNKYPVSFVYGTQRFTSSTIFTSSATESSPRPEALTRLTCTLILSFHVRVGVVRGDFPANVVIHFIYPVSVARIIHLFRVLITVTVLRRVQAAKLLISPCNFPVLISYHINVLLFISNLK